MGQLIKFEFEKLIRRKIVWVGLGLLIFFNISMINGWGSNSIQIQSPDNTTLYGKEAVAYDKEVAKRYEGELTDKKVSDILSEFKNSSEEKHDYRFLNSTIDIIEYLFTNIDGSWNGLTIHDIFPNYNGTLQYGYYSGYSRFISYLSYLVIFAGIIVVIAISPLFTEEYAKGTDALILTTVYGKKQCPRAKIIASLLFSFVLTFVLLLVNLIVFYFDFGFDGGNTSAQINYSGFFTSIAYPITYKQALIYGLVLWIVAIMVLTIIVILCSVLIKSSFITLITALFIYLTPLFISENNFLLNMILSLNPIKSIGLNSVLVNKMFIWVVCGFMVVISFLIWFYATKKFAKHQVL